MLNGGGHLGSSGVTLLKDKRTLATFFFEISRLNCKRLDNIEFEISRVLQIAFFPKQNQNFDLRRVRSTAGGNGKIGARRAEKSFTQMDRNEDHTPKK